MAAAHISTELNLLQKTLNHTGVSGSSKYWDASVMAASFVWGRRLACVCSIEFEGIEGRYPAHDEDTAARSCGGCSSRSLAQGMRETAEVGEYWMIVACGSGASARLYATELAYNSW
jgi:hypothetical protein